MLIGTALGFALGFERGLRGSPAGDRTFSLVGASAAAITAVFYQRSPQVVAGVVTGIGFIGGGVVLHGQGALIRGVTTAATVFATAALGTLVGAGYGVAATVLAALWGWHGLTDIHPGARSPGEDVQNGDCAQRKPRPRRSRRSSRSRSSSAAPG